MAAIKSEKGINPLQLASLHANHPEFFQPAPKTEVHLDLRDKTLAPIQGVDEEKITALCKVVRGLLFATIEGAKSGHPGGSSSKVEQLVTLLCSGALRYDVLDPKNPGRDRIVWSAGHCSPLAHSLVALVYEVMSITSVKLSEKARKAVIYARDLFRFRTWGGPSGHVESHYAFADTSTGSSGHGFSAGLGFALLHKSCGLPMNTFIIAGDAETEEGMSYEARNIASNLGVSNAIVLMDHNGYGIDGSITEALPYPYVNHWSMMGWNVIEVDGHDIRQLATAYHLAARGFMNGKPTVVISHTVKGKYYGKLEDTSDSHGTPLSTPDYIAVMKNLGYADAGKGVAPDIQLVLSSFDNPTIEYLLERTRVAKELIEPEEKLIARMEKALGKRPLADFTSVKRPDVLPPELLFKEGEGKATRFATEAFFKWMMQQNGFFYVGTGDLSKSILTRKAEDVYGIITPENPTGRGIRFGIAEQNMAMMSVAMSQDILPGGLKPMTAFASYGVFTSMMANSVRMGLVNNAMNPDAKSFFIMLAAHDGPETGEDGPTHHGLFWMSLFTAYPGIKVYKPLDANEAIEMLFSACERGEPVAFSVARPNTPVFVRDATTGIPPAREAVNGAYVFKKYAENGKKKLPIVIAGGQMAANLLKVLPKIEEKFDVKIIAVTSPELFEEYRDHEPAKAGEVYSAFDREHAIALHNGWRGFLYPFILPADYDKRALGIGKFLQSGRPDEIYIQAGFDPEGMARTILENAASL